CGRRPSLGTQRATERRRGAETVRGPLEDAEPTVALAAWPDDASAMSDDRFLDELVVTRHRARHLVGRDVPQPGRADDVGEQECDRFGHAAPPLWSNGTEAHVVARRS